MWHRLCPQSCSLCDCFRARVTSGPGTLGDPHCASFLPELLLIRGLHLDPHEFRESGARGRIANESVRRGKHSRGDDGRMEDG